MSGSFGDGWGGTEKIIWGGGDGWDGMESSGLGRWRLMGFRAMAKGVELGAGRWEMEIRGRQLYFWEGDGCEDSGRRSGKLGRETDGEELMEKVQKKGIEGLGSD
ncbi:unnamed protein product [Calypogeia fissa]